ncbi:MAG: stress response translation initiation inhibitor YciH, partial [Synechococcales cyanobacterium RU_4_20]|nr:stress response translation initiation inhibitor YciH [Synechococcales cyanobacterium RU_4_20]
MAKAKKKNATGDATVYREFGTSEKALERPIQEPSPQEQDL